MPTTWIVLIGVECIVIVALAGCVLGLNQRLSAALGSGDRVSGGFGGADRLAGTSPPATPLPHADQLLSPIADRKRTAILFLSGTCNPCLGLSEKLIAAEQAGEAAVKDGNELVVVTDQAGATAFGALGRVIVEADHKIAHSLGVRSTPMGFGVEADGTLLAAELLLTVDDVADLIASK